MPFVAVGVAVWNIVDLVTAVQNDRIGRAVWQGVKALIFIGLAVLMYDTGKRISDTPPTS
jgi:hypothetical protein